MKPFTYLTAAALCLALAAGPAVVAQQQFSSSATTTSTTVTNATGTISQLNYGSDGSVTGFLIGTTTLLSFPTAICGGAGTLGVAGNSVTYSGTAVTSSSGFVSVQVSSFTNNTTKATYTAPTASTAAATYGPTSGTVKQLNYSADGTIDGFLFTAGSSTLFVSLGYTSSTTLSTLLTTGATVSVIGTTSPSMSACTASATLETVRASSLTLGSTTVVFQGGGGPGGYGGPGGPGGPGGGR